MIDENNMIQAAADIVAAIIMCSGVISAALITSKDKRPALNPTEMDKTQKTALANRSLKKSIFQKRWFILVISLLCMVYVLPVSGTIIDKKIYMHHNALTKKLFNAAEKLVGQDSSNDINVLDNKFPEFILLSGSKLFTPGNKPVPIGSELFIRVALPSVHGFSIVVLI